MLLDGALTLVEDTGETVLGPGAAAGWPAGRRNGHMLVNRSAADATFLVAGWRDPDDVCTYSGRDRRYVKSGGSGRFTRRDGRALAPEEDAGAFRDPAPEGPSGVIDIAAQPVAAGSSYPAPHASAIRRSWKRLGKAAGLTQFGVNLVTIAPGGLSSLRHWHSAEDELVWLLDGALTLIEDAGETPLGPGDAAAFRAGVADGHHLANRSAAPATFLVIGTRAARDTCTYADVDLINQTDGPRGWFTTRGGAFVKEQ